MKKFTGRGVYGGIAIGRIKVFRRQEIAVRRMHVEDTAQELERVENAKHRAFSQLQGIYEKALREVGEDNARIFEIHMMMLEDEDYNESIRSIIESQSVNAEYAVAATSDNFKEMFASMEDAYMQARAADVADISDRLLRNLRTAPDEQLQDQGKMIICADDLAPSETVLLDKSQVLAFVTAHGSSNSHTAILARNMNIPAIIGVGEEFLMEISDGDKAIVDGFTGELLVCPDEDTMQEMLKKQREDEEKKSLLQALRGKDNITLDG